MMRAVGRKPFGFSDAKSRSGKEDQLRWVGGAPITRVALSSLLFAYEDWSLVGSRKRSWEWVFRLKDDW